MLHRSLLLVASARLEIQSGPSHGLVAIFYNVDQI